MSTPTTNYGFIKAAEGEQYDVDITNNNLDAIDTQMKAADTKSELQGNGLVWQAHVVGSSGAVNDAIINNIASFTFKANRRYRIVWDFSYYIGGASLMYCTVGLCSTADAAALLSGITVLEGRTKGINSLANTTQHTGPITAYHIQGGADNTTQIKFRVQRVLGGDNMVVVGNANERAIYSIYDDGLQSGSIS